MGTDSRHMLSGHAARPATVMQCARPQYSKRGVRAPRTGRATGMPSQIVTNRSRPGHDRENELSLEDTTSREAMSRTHRTVRGPAIGPMIRTYTLAALFALALLAVTRPAAAAVGFVQSNYATPHSATTSVGIVYSAAQNA